MNVKMTNVKRKIAAVCAAFAIALTAVGCGSSDSSSADKSTTTTKEAVPADADAESKDEPADTESKDEPADPESVDEPESEEDESSEPQEFVPSEDKWEIDAYGQKIYKFSDEYNEFLEGVVFIGDSVCYGLELYDYMPDNNVLAVGSVAARNIFEFGFDVNGTEYSITDAVQLVDPKVVICSMGINDVNLSTEEQFCENYMMLLDRLHDAVPDAQLYVASIPPTPADCDKISNEKVQRYNEVIKEYLANCGKDYGFVEIGNYLKDDQGYQSVEYAGGDGVHMLSHAYSAILYQVCEQLVGPIV